MVNACFYVHQEHTVSKEEQLTLSDSASWQDRVLSLMQSLAAVMTTLEGELPDQLHGPHVTAGTCTRLGHPAP